MTIQEFGTAAQYGAKVIVIVVNNGVYGTIRMHQQRSYPERPSGTTLQNPDFAGLAQCYGGYGEHVYKTEEFPAALARARATSTSAISSFTRTPVQYLRAPQAKSKQQQPIKKKVIFQLSWAQ